MRSLRRRELRVACGGERRQLLFELPDLGLSHRQHGGPLDRNVRGEVGESAGDPAICLLPDASDVCGEPLDFGAGVLSTTVGSLEFGGESLD